MIGAMVGTRPHHCPNSIFTVITSAFIAGGMIGAMVGGLVADKMGRKRGLIISQVVGLLGGVVMAVSEPLTSWEVLLVGRLVAGLTAGLNTVLVPLYVSEIAPVHLRGGLGVFNQLAVTSGIFLGQILGLGDALGNTSGWPWLLAITCLPPLLQLAILAVSPRSPRYLAISLNMPGEARDALLELIGSSKLRLPLLICIFMHLSQQLSGMVAIFYYSISFFTSAGIDEQQAQYANLGVGAIMVAMTLVTIPLMDRLGRRVLHLGGLAGMCAMAILIVIAQNLEDAGGVLIAATLVFVLFFALGPGSIPWMIAGEMFTQGPRPAASALVVFINWAANLAVSLLFPLVLIPELQEFTFLPFAIFIAVFFIFIFLYLPETKGRTVGETTALLQERSWTPSRGS